jgi:RNA polymerase sigma-70 factor (ECF subfamily)
VKKSTHDTTRVREHGVSGSQAASTDADVVSERWWSAEDLFRHYGRFVARFVSTLGVRAVDVEDTVQEVFMVAHRRGGFHAGAARPTSWLAQIAVRVVSTRARTRRRRPEQSATSVLEQLPNTDQLPSDALEAQESLSRLQLALAELDLDGQAVFVLVEVMGESCSDVAVSMDVPVGTIYSRLHKARRIVIAAYEALEAGTAKRGRALNG